MSLQDEMAVESSSATQLLALIRAAKLAPATTHAVFYEKVWPHLYARKHSGRRKLAQMTKTHPDFTTSHVKMVHRSRQNSHIHLTFEGLQLVLASIDSARSRQLLAMCRDAPASVPAAVPKQGLMRPFLEKGKPAAKKQKLDDTLKLKVDKTEVAQTELKTLQMMQMRLDLAKQVMEMPGLFLNNVDQRAFCQKHILEFSSQ